MSGLSPKELADFQKALFSLCQLYGVWVKRNGERREAPSNPIFYYEVELSVKVNPQVDGRAWLNRGEDLVESRK